MPGGVAQCRPSRRPRRDSLPPRGCVALGLASHPRLCRARTCLRRDWEGLAVATVVPRRHPRSRFRRSGLLRRPRTTSSGPPSPARRSAAIVRCAPGWLPRTERGRGAGAVNGERRAWRRTRPRSPSSHPRRRHAAALPRPSRPPSHHQFSFFTRSLSPTSGSSPRSTTPGLPRARARSTSAGLSTRGL